MSVPTVANRKLLTRLRLHAQRLTASALTTPAQVVRHMLAMQAQDFAGAKWSVGLRLPGATEADVERALARGELVRSWPMRGTLHLVAPEDLRLSLTQARAGVAAAGASLEALTLEGTTYYLSPQTAAAPEVPPGTTHALPGFDEYLLGYKDRGAALSPEHKDTIVPGGNGVFMPTLLASGAVVGTWKRVLKSKEVVAEPLPFARLTAQTRAGFARAMAAYGTYLGLPVRVLP